MTENTNISTSGHRRGDKIMAAGELSQRQISRSLKIGQARQKTIKDYLISEFKVSDRLLVFCAQEFDDSNVAKSRVELLL